MKSDSAGVLTIFRLVNARHLWEHRRRILLTLVGLAASVCLLLAISVINSTLDGAIEADARGLAGDASVEVAPASSNGLSISVASAVRKAPGVHVAVPFIRESSVLRSGRRSARTVVIGVSSVLGGLFPGGLGAVERQIGAPGFRAGGLLLTQKVAHAMGVRAGDGVEVETPQGFPRLRVQAVLARGPFASVDDGQFALMELGAAQRVFARGTRIDGVYLGTGDRPPVKALRADLRRRLGGGALVQPPGQGGQAYKRTFDSIASISERSRTVGLLVAFFLVLGAMSMSIAERRREIALLGVTGATRGQILGAVLVEAVVIGSLGSVVGVIGGLLLARALLQGALNSYNILPITSAGGLVVRPQDVLLGVVGGISVAVLGAALPARRILRTTAIAALEPDASYEWAPRHSGRGRRAAAVLGAGTIMLTAALAWLAPLGSSTLLSATVLLLALAGAMLVLPQLVPALADLLARLLSRAFGPVGRLAGGALLRNPGRTVIAAGGLAVASAFVLAVGTSVGSFKAATERAAGEWYGAAFYVNAQGSAAYRFDQPLSVSLGRRLERVPGVRAAYPLRFGLINNKDRQLIIYALPAAEAARRGDRITASLGISETKLVSALGKGEVVVSRLTARRYHLLQGDVLKVPTPSGSHRFKIGGLFDDIASFDSVFLEQSLYEKLSGDTVADRFAIVPGRGVSLRILKHRLEHFVAAERIPASVLTRSQMAHDLVDSIQSLFSVAEGVEVVALLITGLIVLITMLAATFERRYEFAIQRLLGMTRRQLMGSVVLEAIGMSCAGAIIALGLGLGLGFLLTSAIENQLAWNVSFSPSLPAAASTIVAMIGLGALAALYPSLLAVRSTVAKLLSEQ